jgi:hypothetical protein
MLACCTLLKAIQALCIFKRNKKPLETKIDSCLPALHEWTLLQRDDLPDGADRLEPCSCTLFSLLTEEHGVEGKEEGKEAYRYGRDKASGEGYLHMSSDRYRHEGTPFYIRFLPEVIDKHDDICQEGPEYVHQQARSPCGRGPMVSVGPSKVRVEVASHYIWRKEFDRETLQDVQVED